MTATLQKDGWKSAGVTALAPARAFEALEQLMQSDLPQAIVIDADWKRLASRTPSTIFARVAVARSSGSSTETKRGELLRTLETCSTDERESVLADSIRDIAARVLGLNKTEPLDVERPLSELGLDSLMAQDLAKQLGDATLTNFPATLLFNHPTVAALTAHVAELLFSKTADVTVSGNEDEMASLAGEVEAMTQNEVEAMLEAELAEIEDMVKRDAA
jgi:acyl carrier protein